MRLRRHACGRIEIKSSDATDSGSNGEEHSNKHHVCAENAESVKEHQNGKRDPVEACDEINVSSAVPSRGHRCIQDRLTVTSIECRTRQSSVNTPAGLGKLSERGEQWKVGRAVTDVEAACTSPSVVTVF